MTVQELIDALSKIEDRSRKVMMAGGMEAPAIVGRFGSGHVILWPAAKLRAARAEASKEGIHF